MLEWILRWQFQRDTLAEEGRRPQVLRLLLSAVMFLAFTPWFSALVTNILTLSFFLVGEKSLPRSHPRASNLNAWTISLSPASFDSLTKSLNYPDWLWTCDPHASASQGAVITGMHHYTPHPYSSSFKGDCWRLLLLSDDEQAQFNKRMQHVGGSTPIFTQQCVLQTSETKLNRILKSIEYVIIGYLLPMINIIIAYYKHTKEIFKKF